MFNVNKKRNEIRPADKSQKGKAGILVNQNAETKSRNNNDNAHEADPSQYAWDMQHECGRD